VLLDVVGDGLRQRLDRDGLVVAEPLGLGTAAGEVDELARVGHVAGAGDADVVVDRMELLDGGPLHERRADPPVGAEDDAVRGPDADARGAARDGLPGVLDLVEAAVRGEDGDSPVVGLLL